MKYILLFLFISFFSGFGFSQDIEFKKKNFTDQEGFTEALSNLNKGNDLFSKQKKWLYSQALEHFLKANNFNPNNSLLNFKIGICYLNSTDKAASLEYFLKAQSLNPSVDIKLEWAIAQAYHYNLQFDDAISHYNTFLNAYKGTDKVALKPIIEKKIVECGNGKKLVEAPVRVEINNLGPVINSKYTDYVSLVTADEKQLFFTSRREGTTGGEIDPEGLEYIEDIFQSVKENDQWTDPKGIVGDVNTISHDASVGLSEDGKKLFIYKGLVNGGDLYESVLENGLWSAPKSLKKVNSPFKENSACITPDGKTLYLVSDRTDKSYGMRDIYVSHLEENGDWSEPENIGSTINTEYDEEGVSLSPDGNTLYFSSTGHNTMGGYDMFRSTYENGKWSVPENLGYPLNTPDNEMYAQVLGSQENLHGYYSATRKEGLGSIDIYSFHYVIENMVEKSMTDTSDNPDNYTVPIDNGDPSNLFVNVNNGNPDSNNTEKSVITNTENNSENNQPLIVADNVKFKVQVGACRRQIPYAELHQRYPGSKDVLMETHEGWYKYLIGNYGKYSEAKQEKTICGTPDAWVVVYRDGKRVHISEVINMLSYFPFCKLYVLMLS